MPFFNPFQAFGMTPAAAEAAVVDFLKSLWRSGTTLLVAFAAQGYAGGVFASPHTFTGWVADSWWPFLVALFIVPLVQGTHTGYRVTREGAQTPPTN